MCIRDRYEGESPSGSHKPNTAVAQAFYNKAAGIKKLSTETGAGQWGGALAMACQFLGIGCKVYMVKVSYQQKPYRRSVMHLFGADVVASPSEETEAGRAILAQDPDCPGTLGMAISEACEVAIKDPETKYSLGSVLNHVLMHQTVIGEEAIKQLDLAGETDVDVVIGCVGGGSNYAGIAFPFAHDMLVNGKKIDFIAVEPTACPTLTRGPYAYDFGDTAGMTPLLKQYTLGHNFVPPGIHAGGLRYHGVAVLVAHLVKSGHMRAVAVRQNPVFEANTLFARCEGILPAPESGHAIRVAVDEAIKCRESGEAKTILFNMSGHGHFDMTAYDAYLRGDLMDYELEDAVLQEGIASIPKINA